MVAPDLFLIPIIWLLNRTNHHAFLDTVIGTEPFTDLDFADSVVLLTEMLSLLTQAREIMNHEANSLGLQVSWYKINIQITNSSIPPGSYVPMAGDNVEDVESFTYLCVDIHNMGSTEHDIRKCIENLQ